MRIALIQMPVTADRAKNIQTACEKIREAAQNGADFAIGGTFSCKYLVFSISGQKPKIMKRWHSNTPPVVIY